MRSSKLGEMRCFCTRRPLLATYSVKDGEPYLHIKVYKQSRLYGEVFIQGIGSQIKIRCRECLRLHKVTFTQGKPSLEETTTKAEEQ